ncbi:hypothetical protein ACJX0J_019856, partial [Zea mays]
WLIATESNARDHITASVFSVVIIIIIDTRALSFAHIFIILAFYLLISVFAQGRHQAVLHIIQGIPVTCIFFMINRHKKDTLTNTILMEGTTSPKIQAPVSMNNTKGNRKKTLQPWEIN